MNDERLVLVVSVILPEDAPRFRIRIYPLLKSWGCEVRYYSFRGVGALNTFRTLQKIFIDYRKSSRETLFYCLDPMSLIVFRLFSVVYRKPIKFIYDRNERWPLNWQKRKGFLQRLISRIPLLFIWLEKLLCFGAHRVTATDFGTGHVVSQEHCVVIPNRVYLNADSLKGKFSRGSYDFLYHGTIGGSRRLDSLLPVFRCHSAENKQCSKLVIYSRENPKFDSQRYAVEYRAFETDALSGHADSYVCGIVVMETAPYLERLIPSKIAFYWASGLPVLVVGNTRALRLLSSFYPDAIKLFDPEKDAESWGEVLTWCREADVNYRPREICRDFTI